MKHQQRRIEGSLNKEQLTPQQEVAMSSMKIKKQTVIRRVLEETGNAYQDVCEYSHVNADYAEFASSQALSSFQSALQDPHLSYEELCQMLRRASNNEARRQCKTPWSIFMANYISTRHTANGNNGIRG